MSNPDNTEEETISFEACVFAADESGVAYSGDGSVYLDGDEGVCWPCEDSGAAWMGEWPAGPGI